LKYEALQISGGQILECQTPLHKRKAPLYWRLSGDDSGYMWMSK